MILGQRTHYIVTMTDTLTPVINITAQIALGHLAFSMAPISRMNTFAALSDEGFIAASCFAKMKDRLSGKHALKPAAATERPAPTQ